MERIKNALEKARSNQGQQNLHKRPVSERSAYSLSVRPDKTPPLSELNYDETRVITLDQKLLERNRIVSNSKRNVHSNIFDLLRTQVLSRMKANNWQTIAVVSPTPAAGKSVVSINLAMSIAQYEEKSAMLIDFDLRRPSVAGYLGLEKGPCVADLLSGQCEMKDALINPGIPRLVILPAHRSVPNSAEILASKQVTSLIEEVKNKYPDRIVVFDLPPLLNADDAMAVLPNIDCVLFVVASGMVRQKEVVESLRYIQPEKLIGTVFNKAHSEASPYYYG